MQQALRSAGHLASKLASSSLQNTYQAALRPVTSASSVGFSLSHELKDGEMAWKKLMEQGLEINPCGSGRHPAVKAGLMESSDAEVSLQESYSPSSKCYGCGHSHGPGGLNLRSYRDDGGGLVAHMEFSEDLICFPGVISSGAISTVLDCHGNWAAAIQLMDNSCLPRPPLTVTYSVTLTYNDMTPSRMPVILRAKAGDVTRSKSGKPTVEVDLGLFLPQADGSEKQLVKGTGIFKKFGALRAL